MMTSTHPEDLAKIRSLVQRRIHPDAEVAAARCVEADPGERMYVTLWVYREPVGSLLWGTHVALVGIDGTGCAGLTELLWGHYYHTDEAHARQDWSKR